MTKKSKNETPTPVETSPNEAYNLDTDFNIDEEYKPLPLIPSGTYLGAVTKVAIIPDEVSICWDVTLNNNGGTKSDGETEIDGSVLSIRNWLPKPGDEDRRTKSGAQTVREAKISFMKDFQERMKVDMNTSAKVAEAIANGDWIGIAVRAKITVREYEGRFSNQIDTLTAEE